MKVIFVFMFQLQSYRRNLKSELEELHATLNDEKQSLIHDTKLKDAHIIQLKNEMAQSQTELKSVSKPFFELYI